MEILQIDLRKASKKEKLEIANAILFAKKVLKREELRLFIQKIPASPVSKFSESNSSILN